jgi:nucleotide-binding universal stress UspA family protein
MRKAMKILLAVDGSDFSLAAVDEAARLPWPEGSTVRIISVAELSLPAAAGETSIPIGSYEEMERIIEERCEESVNQAMARFYQINVGQVEVKNKVIRGEPKTAILDEAQQWGADLIILGTHGYNAFERLWLGSVSRTVLSNAKCSVEIVRRRDDQVFGRRMRKILLAVDGSEPGAAAVDEVADRPWPQGSEVHVISVVELPFTPTPETWSLPESYYSQLEKSSRERATSAVENAISRLRESNSAREVPLTLTSEVIVGHAEETILKIAKSSDADLVVLGSHGYRGFQRFLLGSVSQAVAYHAPCSVEIVRKQAQTE